MKDQIITEWSIAMVLSRQQQVSGRRYYVSNVSINKDEFVPGESGKVFNQYSRDMIVSWEMVHSEGKLEGNSGIPERVIILDADIKDKLKWKTFLIKITDLHHLEYNFPIVVMASFPISVLIKIILKYI